MKLNRHVDTTHVRRFNKIMVASGFLSYDDQGHGAFILNLVDRYPGYRDEVAAALWYAVDMSWPEAELGALDVADLQTALELI